MLCKYLHCIRKAHYRLQMAHPMAHSEDSGYAWCCSHHLKEYKLFFLQDAGVWDAFRDYALKYYPDASRNDFYVETWDIDKRVLVSRESLIDIQNAGLEDPLNREYAQMARYGEERRK